MYLGAVGAGEDDDACVLRADVAALLGAQQDLRITSYNVCYTKLLRENFAALACLNASSGGMDVIEHVVRRELSGWV